MGERTSILAFPPRRTCGSNPTDAPGLLPAPRAGERIGHTPAVTHLGGATLDNEENCLIEKLFTAGLGMVAVSNQARI